MPRLQTPETFKHPPEQDMRLKYVFIRMLQKNIKSRNFRARPKNQSDFARIFGIF